MGELSDCQVIFIISTAVALMLYVILTWTRLCLLGLGGCRATVAA